MEDAVGKHEKAKVLEKIDLEKLYVALEREWGEDWTLDETHGAKLFSNLFDYFELRRRTYFWNWERMKGHGIVKAITPYVCLFYLEDVLQSLGSYTYKFDKDFMRSVFDRYECEYDNFNGSRIQFVFSENETWDILVENDLVSSLNMFIATKILVNVLTKIEEFKQIRDILLDHCVPLDWYFILHHDPDGVDERARSMYGFRSYSYVRKEEIGHDLWRIRKPTAKEMEEYVLPTDEGMRRLSHYIFLDRQGWFTFLKDNDFLKDLTDEQKVELIHDDVKRLQTFVEKKVIALPTVLESIELRHKVNDFAHMFKVSDDTEGTPEQKISLLNHREPDKEEVEFISRNKEYLELVPLQRGREWWKAHPDLVEQCKAIVKTAAAAEQVKINYLVHRIRFVFGTFTEDELNTTFDRDDVERARRLLK